MSPSPLPAEGINISSKAALCWCIAELRGAQLETLKVRGRRMTSRQALGRFIAATQELPKVSDNPGRDRPRGRQPDSRRVRPRRDAPEPGSARRRGTGNQ